MIAQRALRTSILFTCAVCTVGQMYLFRNLDFAIEPYFDEMWRLDSITSVGGLDRYTIGAPISPFWIVLFSVIPDPLQTIQILRYLNLILTVTGVTLLVTAFMKRPESSMAWIRSTFIATTLVSLFMLSPSLVEISRYFNNYGTEIFCVGISVHLMLRNWEEKHMLITLRSGILVGCCVLITQGGIPAIIVVSIVLSLIGYFRHGQSIWSALAMPSIICTATLLQLLVLLGVNYFDSLSGLSSFWGNTILSNENIVSYLIDAVLRLPNVLLPIEIYFESRSSIQVIVKIGLFFIIILAVAKHKQIQLSAIIMFATIILLAMTSLIVSAPFLPVRVNIASYSLFAMLLSGAVFAFFDSAHRRHSSIIYVATSACLMFTVVMNLNSHGTDLIDSPSSFARGLLKDITATEAEVVKSANVEVDEIHWVSFHPMSHWYVRYSTNTINARLTWENWGTASEMYDESLGEHLAAKDVEYVVCVIPWEVGPVNATTACQLRKNFELINTFGGNRAEFRLWKVAKEINPSINSAMMHSRWTN